ncbi:MAG: hypothetical protein AAF628_04050 [Planctomycetota bacterium]
MSRALPPVAFLAAAFSASVFLAAPAGSQTLLRDINTQPATGNPGSKPSLTTAAGGWVYFVADTPAYGTELWRTDGTAAGTGLVRDLADGVSGSDPADIVGLPGGTVLFTARTSAVGKELWRTDGSSSGTTLVVDLQPGAVGSAPCSLTVFGNAVYFFADDGTGLSLWSSDGTAAGTLRLKEIPGGYCRAVTTASTNDWLLFTVNTPFGHELWRSDGSVSGTELVAPITQYRGRQPRDFVSLGSRAVFRAEHPTQGEEVWVTDGTTAGTKLLADLELGSRGSMPDHFYAAGGLVYFQAVTYADGLELYRTDGTTAGTFMVFDSRPGPGTAFPFPLGELGGELLFRNYVLSVGEELWKTDGTTGGTVQVASIGLGAIYDIPGDSGAVGNQLLFRANAPGVGEELWITDGTAAGTGLAADLRPGAAPSRPELFAALPGGAGVVFRADDGLTGAELWFADATPGSATRLGDLAPGAINDGSQPDLLDKTVNGVFFSANDGVIGRELYFTDGTPSGTRLVIDLAPGAAGGLEAPGLAWSFGVALRDELVFWGDDGGGRRLWITDGTAGGTRRLADVDLSFGASPERTIAQLGDRVFFSATSPVYGAELWVSDGTSSGTQLLIDYVPGSSGIDPAELFVWNDRLYFIGRLAGRRVLFTSDGTPGGTLALTAGHFASQWNPQFIGHGDLVFFASAEVGGEELWRSNGTPTGTWRVANIGPSIGSSYPGGFAVVDGWLLFFASDGYRSRDLWRTDGTPAGTVKVFDFAPTMGYEDMQSLGDEALFWVDDGTTNENLWRTDGTAAGTSLVTTVESSGRFFHSRLLARPGVEQVWLTAHDGASGAEVWSSDGTAAGTALRFDLAPGGLSSAPSGFLRLRDRVLVIADDGQSGVELHAVELIGDDDYAVQVFGRGCPGAGAVTPDAGFQGAPIPGGGFALRLHEGAPLAAGALLFGANAAWLPLGGCPLHVAPPLATVPVATDATGSATVPVAIVAGLAGLVFDAQFAVLDPAGAWFAGVSATPGIEVVVGR